jgi:hypothetical protein
MANFTQLHLGNNNSPEQPAHKNQQEKKPISKEKALFGAGLLAVTVMSGVFLLITNGCSKGSSKAASIEQPTPINPQAVITPPVSPVAAVQLPTVTPKPAKKRVQHKAPMATYKEPTYGVSFRYPKSYILKTDDEPELELAELGPVQTEFVQPGGVTVAAVEMPRSSYPGTDFTVAFFSVSVNSSLSKDQCQQFAFPKSEHTENEPAVPAKVKLGGTDFTMAEDFGDSAKKEPRMKYFHHFENGNCYEFSMGLSTVDDNVAGLKPVNRSLVFGKLEQILASVKMQPVSIPQVAKGTPVHPAMENNSANPVVEGSKE